MADARDEGNIKCDRYEEQWTKDQRKQWRAAEGSRQGMCVFRGQSLTGKHRGRLERVKEKGGEQLTASGMKSDRVEDT